MDNDTQGQGAFPFHGHLNVDAELKAERVRELRLKNEQRELKIQSIRKTMIAVTEFHVLVSWFFETARAAFRAHVNDDDAVNAAISEIQKRIDERFTPE